MATNKSKKMSKKEQFTPKKGSKKSLFAVILTVLILGAATAGIALNNSENATDVSYSGEQSAETRSYIGRVVPMTSVEPSVGENLVSIPLDLLEEKDIVYFEVENNEGFLVPLMAYITPSGRIFTGSSMCEPCGGRYFSLAGETLVCDTCRTTYTIEDRVFISGSKACGSFPPVYMSSSVENGLINIDLEEIREWRIRAY
jgi:hypothetical protein